MAVKGLQPLDPWTHFLCHGCGRTFNRTQIKYWDGNEHCTECWEAADEPETTTPPALPPRLPDQYFVCENCGRKFNVVARDPETGWDIECREALDAEINYVAPKDATKRQIKMLEDRKKECMDKLEKQIAKVEAARDSRAVEIEEARETGDTPVIPEKPFTPNVDESTPSMSGDRGSDGQ